MTTKEPTTRQLLGLVLKVNVSHAARLLWLLLYTDHEITWRATMARMMGLSIRQTDRCLEELEAAGLVTRLNRWKAGLHGTGIVWNAQLPPEGTTKEPAAKQIDLEDLIASPPTAEDVWAAKKFGGG